MRNTIIRVIAFIFALVSICAFIIGSTLEGIATEWDFEGYNTYQEFYEGNNEEYSDIYIENIVDLYTNQNTVSDYEELIYYIESYNLEEVAVRLTTIDGDVVYDNVPSDYSGISYNVIELSGYSGPGVESFILELHVGESFNRGYVDPKGIQEGLEFMYNTRDYTEFAIIISSIITALSLFILILLVGKDNNSNEIKLSIIDRFPLEIGIAFNIFLTGLICTYITFYYEISFTLVLLSLFFIVLIQLISFLTIVVRLKSKTLISNSITYIVLKWLLSPIRYFMGVIKYAFLEIPLVLKASLILIILGFMALIGLVSSYFIWTIAMIISAVIFMMTYFYLANLKSSIKKISEGDLDYKTDTKYMILDFKEMAENLNKINEGLEEATQKKIKSERLKAELITNVSHDIKTPLTSIINYVDLIKKQNIQDETVNEYVEVLERQTQKLKRLTTDLVDASKINSGNIESNLEDVFVSVILGQIEGEYKEKLTENSLNLIINYPKEDLVIKADPKHLNRIIDNLMINILKYSLENTRVYIDVTNNEKSVSVIIKNTSKMQLNISADELMQRFVRGDESRNTEGNGLGLSIAQSLASTQGAELEITVDGDLFKAEIIYNILQ